MSIGINPLPEYWPSNRRIIAVDGEGTTVGDSHGYLLLAAHDDRDFKRHIWYNPDNQRAGNLEMMPNPGLTTIECFEFLLDLPQRHSDLFVAFSFSYDIFQMVRDLPLPNLRELFGPDKKTRWGKYLITYWARKWFTVSDTSKPKAPRPDGSINYLRTIKVWDSFGFFGQAFVSALEGSAHLFSPDDKTTIEMIKEMKRQRSGPDLFKDPEKTLDYCYSECRFLSTMMRDILISAEKLGVRLNSFHGSSAISGQWMKDRRIKNRVGTSCVPESIIMAGYYGGRFEQSCIGYVGDGYSYDINSAYPAEMVALPCLTPGHTTSREVTEYEPGKLGIYLTGSETAGEWAPFPFRIDRPTAASGTNRRKDEYEDTATAWLKPLLNRRVLFAHGGKRWVWSPEVEIARKWHGKQAIPVYAGWVLEQHCTCPNPFQEIAGLYEQRRRIKNSEPGLQMAIKLLINSIYGKTAQSVGWTPGNRDSKPDYLCYIWAGLITSGTRASIYDKVMESGTCVSIATDGIITRQPMNIDNSKTLGEWEANKYRNVYLYSSGVYSWEEWKGEFDKTTGEAVEPGEWKPVKLKSRGFSPSDITADMLRNAWNTGLWSISPKMACRDCGAIWLNQEPENCPDCGKAYVPPTALLSIRSALKRKTKDITRLAGQWLPANKEISFRPTKRYSKVAPVPTLEGRAPLLPTFPDTLPLNADGTPPMSLSYEPAPGIADQLALEDMFDTDIDDDAPEL